MATALPDRIETPRLVLRDFRVEDVRPLVPLLDDWRVAQWLANVPHPYTAAHAREWVEAATAYRIERRALCLVIADAVNNQPVGGIEVNLERFELGYWIGVPFQGRGYAGEAVDAMVRLAFEALGAPLLGAATLPGNLPSSRVLRRAGFEPLGTALYDFMLRGGRRPGELYCLTAERWRTLAAGAAP